MSDQNHNLEHLRHSLAHLLAAAVMELHPKTKRTIGPAIENGFYFDFEFDQPIAEADLPKIEAKMRQILPTWHSFERFEVSKEEALKEYVGNEYKIELIEEFSHGMSSRPSDARGEISTESSEISPPVIQGSQSRNDTSVLTIYQSGNYRDLCKGGHVDDLSTFDPNAFKLTHTAGAYWRGNEKNKMLTRIYGLAFATKLELDQHLTMLEEAAKRDHRKLGPQLDLFTFSDLVGPGLPLWTPKGTLLRETLDNFVQELRGKYGYERVEIPHITKKDLYEKSGHWDKFKDELFRIKTREGHEFAMKPMNCPHHTQIFKRKAWSYRDLPQRYANTTMCYRDEQTGELNGLSRVRSFTQDDAHVFCRPQQVRQEMLNVWDIVEQFYAAFGFNLRVRLSFWDEHHPEKYLGDKQLWLKAQAEIENLAKEKKAEYVIATGEAAFYGPKIDFMGKDSLGREWQVATIQLDMNLPARFDLTYTTESGTDEHVVMIHAAIMGSIERFLAILIEHTAGAFPLWLAPQQIAILPIAERHHEYAASILQALQKAGIRVKTDDRNETLGKRIRENELQKVPYLLVLGDKEVENKTVSVRSIKNGDEGAKNTAELVDQLLQEIENKS